MSAIAVSQVRLVRDGRVVLEGIDLEVSATEHLCLIGASGSGKTSLLRVIAGLEEPEEGEVLVQGTSVSGTRRDVTMVFQDDVIYEHLDVTGNLDFPFRVTEGIEAQESKVGEVADMFAIRRLLSRQPGTLSAGQRRVVSAARALVRPDVSVVLMDEPLVGTDPHRRARLVEAVMKRSELTVVLATNDPTDVLRWADRVAVMVERRLVQVGSPEDVYRRPVSLAAAEAIGEMNRIPAAVTAESGWSLEVGGSRIGLDTVPAGMKEGQRVVLGIRPSDLRPAWRGTPFDRRLRGSVGRVEPIGGTQRILFGLGETKGVGFVAEIDADEHVRAGDRLDWHVDPSAVRLFEPVTGEAL